MKFSRSQIELYLNNSKVSGNQLQLDNEDLSGLDLSGLDLSGVSFRRTNLTGTNLCGAILTNAVLTDSNLTEANLITANLFNANLATSYLDRANLMAANLERTNLTDAKCNESNFIVASLRNAILNGAIFKRAHLNGTDFRGCNFKNADLDGAFYNHFTEWPDNFDAQSFKGKYSRDVDPKLSELYKIYFSVLMPRNPTSSVSENVLETSRSKQARMRKLQYFEEQIKVRESEWDIVRQVELKSDTGKELERAFADWLKVLDKLACSKSKDERSVLNQQKGHLEAILWESYIKHKEAFPLPVLYSCKWLPSELPNSINVEYRTLQRFTSKQQFFRLHEKCYHESRCVENYTRWIFGSLFIILIVVIAILVISFGLGSVN